MMAIYAWGANSHGQLGLGFVSEQVVHPEKVQDLPDNLNVSSVKAIVGGGGHSFILTTNGHLYGAGCNLNGQIGDGTQVPSVSRFRLIHGLEDSAVIQVACGWSHSVALTENGKVWTWGSNSHNQLGLPKQEVPYSSLPICIELPPVVSVACGLRHTAAATRDGRIYTWGSGRKGQLGLFTDREVIILEQPVPKDIESLEEKSFSVSCGQNTTYAITSTGHIIAWGDNKWGQLTLNPRDVAYFSYPCKIASNYFSGERIKWIASGWTHACAGTSSGSIFVWGRADYGQLADGRETAPLTYQYIPCKLKFESEVVSLLCGSEHNLALVEERGDSRSIYSWGWNEHGNCGTGLLRENVLTPQKIDLPGNVVLLGVGAAHSFALIDVYF